MSRGFTLLELLLASALLTIMALAAFLLYDANARLQVQADGVGLRAQGAQAAARALESDLRGAWISQTLDDQKTRIPFVVVSDRTPDGDDDDTLDFISAAGGGLGDLVHVQFYVERDPAAPENSRLMRVTQPFMAERAGGTSRMPLGENAREIARGVVGFNVKVSSGGGWRESWDSSRDGKWPDGVQVTITGATRDGGELRKSSYSTKVPLRLVKERGTDS